MKRSTVHNIKVLWYCHQHAYIDDTSILIIVYVFSSYFFLFLIHYILYRINYTLISLLNASKKSCFFVCFVCLNVFLYNFHLLFQFFIYLFRLIQNKRIEYEKFGVQITTNLGETKHVLLFIFFLRKLNCGLLGE